MIDARGQYLALCEGFTGFEFVLHADARSGGVQKCSSSDAWNQSAANGLV